MGLAQFEGTVTPHIANSPEHHRFWVENGKIMHSYRQATIALEFGDYMPYRAAKNAFGAFCAVRVHPNSKNFQGTVKIRMRNGVTHYVFIPADSVIIIYKGKRCRWRKPQ